MDDTHIMIDAQEAYKKFIKSSKNFFGLSQKKRENLKSFSEEQKKENAYNSVYLGLKEVPINKIIGSVEKFEDFDKNFVPQNNIVKTRWMNIYKGYMKEEMLPTVNLYKIKDNYYVYDGNHRISVAKYLNFSSIEAEVEEFLPTTDEKEEILYREKMIFEKNTDLTDVFLTEITRYKNLKNEIDNFVKKVLEIEKYNKNIEELSVLDYKKICKKWYKNIFLQALIMLEENDILKNYEKENINICDLFCFYLEHKYYLSKNFGKDMGYLYSLINFINLAKTRENDNKKVDGICKIENKESYTKLKNIDNYLFGVNIEKNIEIDKEKFLKILYKKINKLPNNYSEKLLEIKEENIYCNILKYSKIIKWNSLNELIGEYLLEVFIPLFEISNKYELNNEQYNLVKEDYFKFLKLEEEFFSEGKILKYVNLFNDNIENFAEFQYDKKIMDILIEEKKEEFLKNLYIKENFYNMCEKYGNIKRYETYIYLFKWLDIIGEKELFKKIFDEMDKIVESDKILEYKTNKVIKLEEENIDFDFIDYYIENIE